MNRRDIIITAVLINAGLLIVLFVSSLKSHDPTELVVAKKEVVVEKKKVVPEAPSKKVEKPVVAVKKAPEIKKEEPKKAAVKLAPKEEALAVVEVKSGDALEKIARRHNVEVDELMRINNLASARLQIGQKLKVPSTKKVAELPKEKKEAGEYYIMRHGDNLWNIARENHIKFEDLLELNDLNEEKSRRLKPGARIRIK